MRGTDNFAQLAGSGHLMANEEPGIGGSREVGLAEGSQEGWTQAQALPVHEFHVLGLYEVIKKNENFFVVKEELCCNHLGFILSSDQKQRHDGYL